ncbi:peptidoglycan-binding protein [Pseudophaeobacter sp. TrK17]|uniref:peptidoglycan-binding domain-containing protein n=1 Tax=Pseudophaeobacter sp. TrK17 TaxID=2815167 RepID=UPI0035CFB593
MRKILSVLLASTYLTFAPLAAVADEAEMKAQVAEISAGLVERLPMDQKIVLKALSPEQSGLPEDFLRKLTSDLEAALLVASEFNINLANRLSTEDLWSEATEFGDADFENLYAASQADIMLMLTPRATGAGVEISITAYRLLGDDAGQVIASSGSVVLAMDMENSLGVDVNSLNDQMAQVLAEIEKVGQTGGLITSPSTYAEYYHNARILQQRGEIDLAMANLEEALSKSQYPFIDPVQDLYDLAYTKYGENGERYLVGRVMPLLDQELKMFLNLLINPKSFNITPAELTSPEGVFLPIQFIWLEQNLKNLEEEHRKNLNKKKIDYGVLYVLLETSRNYLSSLRDGSFQSYFIDKFRAKQTLSVSDLRSLIEEFSFVGYSYFETDYQIGTGTKAITPVCDERGSCPGSMAGTPGFNPFYDVQPSKPFDEDFEYTVTEINPDYASLPYRHIYPTLSKEMLTTIANRSEGVTEVSWFTHESHMGPCGYQIEKQNNLDDLIKLRKPTAAEVNGVNATTNFMVVSSIDESLTGSGLNQGTYLWSINGKPVFGVESLADLIATSQEDADISFTWFDANGDVQGKNFQDINNIFKGMSERSIALKQMNAFSEPKITMEEHGKLRNTPGVVPEFDYLIYADLCWSTWQKNLLASNGQNVRYGTEVDPLQYPQVDESKGNSPTPLLKLHPNAERIDGLDFQSVRKSYGYFGGKHMLNSDPRTIGLYTALQNNIVTLSGVSGLFITDNVDRSKPIIVIYEYSSYYGNAMWELPLGAVDVTLDGSRIDPNGIPFHAKQETLMWKNPIAAEATSYPNDWLYIPGVVQGFSGFFPNKIVGVFYTDSLGFEKYVGKRKVTSKYNESDYPPGFVDAVCLPKGPYGNFIGEGHLCENYFYGEQAITSRASEPSLGYCENLECINNPDIGAGEFSEARYEFFHDKNSYDALKKLVELRSPTASVVNSLESTFKKLPVAERKFLQERLRESGFYNSAIDGAWGNGTRLGFEKLFALIDEAHPERLYLTKYGLSDGVITDSEFVSFWNDMYSCDAGKLLSTTRLCN